MIEEKKDDKNVIGMLAEARYGLAQISMEQGKNLPTNYANLLKFMVFLLYQLTIKFVFFRTIRTCNRRL